MNLRTLVPPILIAVMLAACSGGGTNTANSASSALPQSGTTASGTLLVDLPRTTSASSSRNPAFVSTGVAHAAVFIGGSATNNGSTTSCSSTTCTITWTYTITSSSTVVNFAVEVDDNSTNCTGSKACALGEGVASETIVAGANGTLSIPVIINGIATAATFTAFSIASNVATGTYAVTDKTNANITNKSASGTSAVFDNSTSTGLGIAAANVTGSITAPTIGASSLAAPNAAGNNYTVTAACTSPFTNAGTFGIALTPGTASGAVSTSPELSGVNVVYPTYAGTTSYTFACDTSGNITVTDGGDLTVEGQTRI
jgi:hypothetical protein